MKEDHRTDTSHIHVPLCFVSILLGMDIYLSPPAKRAWRNVEHPWLVGPCTTDPVGSMLSYPCL